MRHAVPPFPTWDEETYWTYAVPVRYTCGHLEMVERDTLEKANYVAEYAAGTPCWECWLKFKKYWNGKD